MMEKNRIFFPLLAEAERGLHNKINREKEKKSEGAGILKRGIS